MGVLGLGIWGVLGQGFGVFGSFGNSGVGGLGVGR